MVAEQGSVFHGVVTVSVVSLIASLPLVDELAVVLCLLR